MHISDGVLSLPVLAAGFGGTAAATAWTLRRVRDDDVPRMAVLTAAFFVGSLIHIPLGPASLHLVLNGLAGVVLGAAAFPAILIGLTLQAMLFQHGGITALGVNACIMGLPALAVGIPFQWVRARVGNGIAAALAGGAGAAAIALSGLALAAILATADERFVPTARLVLAAHLPLMAAEGLVTGTAVAFLLRVKPEMIRGSRASRLGAVALALGMLAAALAPAPAWAHRLLLEVLSDGAPGRYRVEAFYADGRPAAGARVEVAGLAEGARAGTTDESGAFAFDGTASAAEIRVVVDAGMGHRAEVAAALPAAQAPVAPSDARASRTAVPWTRALAGLAAIAALAWFARRAIRRASAAP